MVSIPRPSLKTKTTKPLSHLSPLGSAAFLPREQPLGRYLVPLLHRLLLASSLALCCPDTSSSCLASPSCFPPSFPKEQILRARPGANSGFDRCLTWRDCKLVFWRLEAGKRDIVSIGPLRAMREGCVQGLSPWAVDGHSVSSHSLPFYVFYRSLCPNFLLLEECQTSWARARPIDLFLT